MLNPIENLWWATGEAGGFYGLPTADAVGVTGEGQWQRFQHGVIFHSNSGAVNAVTGAYFTKWDQLGGAGAGLGFPLSGPVAVAGGFQQAFAYGALYTSSATGMHVVDGALYPAYRRLGGPAGRWASRTTDPYAWDAQDQGRFPARQPGVRPVDRHRDPAPMIAPTHAGIFDPARPPINPERRTR